MDKNKELLDALDKVGIKSRKVDLDRVKTVMKNRDTVTCPVCNEEDVYDDIGAHGPGISVIVYSCGCSYTVESGKKPTMTRYDGEIFIDDV